MDRQLGMDYDAIVITTAGEFTHTPVAACYAVTANEIKKLDLSGFVNRQVRGMGISKWRYRDE